MQYLRESTATAVLIGPFIDDSDGKTPETGLTVTSMDADLYKHSNTHPLTKGDLTITASGGSNDCAHVANGYYSLELTATDTNTCGRLILSVNITGALPVWHELTVLASEVFDSLVLGTDLLQADLTQIGGSAVSTTTAQLGVNVVQVSEDATAADNIEADYDGTGYNKSASTIGTVTALASGAIAAASIVAAAANKIADHVIRRTFANARGSSDGDTVSFRSLLGAIAKLVNRIASSGGTLTIYQENDITSLGTQAITTSGSADPITELDTT